MRVLKSRKDIELLVESFYESVKNDELIAYFFTEVVELDWNHHIPRICDFWESVILGTKFFDGNPMIKHIELNQKSALKKLHFNRWLKLWNQTVDSNFSGEMADKAKSSAYNIAQLMQHKIKTSQEFN